MQHGKSQFLILPTTLPQTSSLLVPQLLVPSYARPRLHDRPYVISHKKKLDLVVSCEFSLHVRDAPDPVKGNTAHIRMVDILKVKVRGVFVCVCRPQLTYVDPAAVTLHQQQDKDVKRNEVDDEDVPAPRRHLWSKPKI